MKRTKRQGKEGGEGEGGGLASKGGFFMV